MDINRWFTKLIPDSINPFSSENEAGLELVDTSEHQDVPFAEQSTAQLPVLRNQDPQTSHTDQTIQESSRNLSPRRAQSENDLTAQTYLQLQNRPSFAPESPKTESAKQTKGDSHLPVKHLTSQKGLDYDAVRPNSEWQLPSSGDPQSSTANYLALQEKYDSPLFGPISTRPKQTQGDSQTPENSWTRQGGCGSAAVGSIFENPRLQGDPLTSDSFWLLKERLGSPVFGPLSRTPKAKPVVSQNSQNLFATQEKICSSMHTPVAKRPKQDLSYPQTSGNFKAMEEKLSSADVQLICACPQQRPEDPKILESLCNLQGSYCTLQGSSSLLQGSSSTLQRSSNTLQGSSNTLQGRSSALQGSSSSLQGSSSTLQGSSNTLQGSSSKLQGSSNTLQGSSNALQRSSSKLQGSSIKLQGSSSKLQGSSSALQGSSSKLQGSSSALQESSSSFQGRDDEHQYVRQALANSNEQEKNLWDELYEQTDEQESTSSNSRPSSPVKVCHLILQTIKKLGTANSGTGSTVQEIDQYMRTHCDSSVANMMSEIQSFVQDALGVGTLMEVNPGRYALPQPQGAQTKSRIPQGKAKKPNERGKKKKKGKKKGQKRNKKGKKNN